MNRNPICVTMVSRLSPFRIQVHAGSRPGIQPRSPEHQHPPQAGLRLGVRLERRREHRRCYEAEAGEVGRGELQRACG